MHDQPRPWHAHLPPTAPEDDGTAQVLVLTLLFSKHPEGMTIRDLALELSRDETDDWVERAVRDLVGVGLVRCEGCLTVAVFEFLDAGDAGQGQSPSQ